MKGGIYLPGTEKVDLDSVAVEGVEMVSLNEAHLKLIKVFTFYHFRTFRSNLSSSWDYGRCIPGKSL